MQIFSEVKMYFFMISFMVINLNVFMILARNVRTIAPSQPPNCDLVKTLVSSSSSWTTFNQTGFKKGDICNGNCCDKRTEELVMSEIHQNFSIVTTSSFESLHVLLEMITINFEKHVITLTEQSQNETLNLMVKIYNRMAFLTEKPIETLYAHIRQYIQIQDNNNAGKLNIKLSTNTFFTDIFPLVYHQAIHAGRRDFSQSYKECLKSLYDDINPFETIPKQIAISLQKSLESTRLLLEAFYTGISVLNRTNELLNDAHNMNNECRSALLKLMHCPKCLGYNQPVKPCTGYCLNVLRGCLTRYVTALDNPWKSLIDGIERMITVIRQENNEIGVNMDIVMRSLHHKISEAIMAAIIGVSKIKLKVEDNCGQMELDKSDTFQEDETTNLSDAKSYRLSIGSRNQTYNQNRFPDSQLLNFLMIIIKRNDFFSTLADNYCKDISFVESKEHDCWNGHEIGKYLKTIVEAKTSMQKYNPELKISEDEEVGDKITDLADELQHIHHIIMAQVNLDNAISSDRLMQSDDSMDSSGDGEGIEDDFDNEMSGSGEFDTEHSITKIVDSDSTSEELTTIKLDMEKDFAIKPSNSQSVIIINIVLILVAARFLNY